MPRKKRASASSSSGARRRPATGRSAGADLADTLQDCRAVLVASAGQAPREALVSRGIKLVMMEGLIDEGLDAVFRGEEIRAPLRKNHRCGSGAGCSGNGQGMFV